MSSYGQLLLSSQTIRPSHMCWWRNFPARAKPAWSCRHQTKPIASPQAVEFISSMDAFYLHHQGHRELFPYLPVNLNCTASCHVVDHERCHIHKVLLGVYSERRHLPGALHRQQQCTTAVQSAGSWEDTTIVRKDTLGSISGAKWCG